MAALTKDRLLFDPADLTESDNIGAYVRAGSDGDKITSTLIGAKEALDVNLVGGSDSGIFAEDSAHNSGDLGQFVLAVQTASQGALGADGDYVPFQVDSNGRLRTITDLDLSGDLVGDDETDTEDPLKVGSRTYDQASALQAVSAAGDKANLASDLYRRVFINDAPNINAACNTFSVGNVTEVAIPTTALAGRTRMIIQNASSNDIYVGPTGVLVSTGLRIVKGATLTLEIGESVALFALASSGAANDVRIFELA